MVLEDGEWIVTESELGAIAEGLGLRNGLLGVLPREASSAPEAREVLDAFRSLEAGQRQVLESVLGVLASPRKLARLHTVQGGEVVSRAVLATKHDFGGGWATLASSGNVGRVSLRSEAELRLLVQRTLAADDSLRGDRLGLSLSTPAALAFLAAADHLRRVRLIALVRHEEVPDIFSPQEVAARLQESDVEDFRWVLPFLDKLLPLKVRELAVSKDPVPALAELAQRGLIEAFDESVPPTLFQLSEAGRFVAAGLRHEVSRAALGVTAFYEDDAVGHDAYLFVRSPYNLFMVHLSGPAAGLSTVLAGDLDLALQLALAPPPAPMPKPVARVETLPSEPPAAEATARGERTVVWDETFELIPLTLVVEQGTEPGKVYTLVKPGTVGRQAGNDIVLEDPGVSRKHASLDRGEDGVWVVTDLKSSNGTYVNGEKIESPATLRPGDAVRISQTVFRFNPSPQGS